MPVSLPFLLDEGEKIAPPKWLAIVLPVGAYVVSTFPLVHGMRMENLR